MRPTGLVKFSIATTVLLFSTIDLVHAADETAPAQGTTPPAQEETKQVERVEVTGTNIRRTDVETPSPVQVISNEDLKKSGYTTVAQVLQQITANGQGTLSQSFPGAFAVGASALSLRGLNSSATLTLIDGHRMAPNPLADDGQRFFVDISNIPFDAIERIEILKDGASSIYGSDAMAGVVNIILKKNIVGTSLTGRLGTTTEGGGTTGYAAGTTGIGDLEKDGYNAYIGVEFRKQGDITYAQRAGAGQWSSLDASSLGGVNKTPGIITPEAPIPGTQAPYLTNPNYNPASGSNFTANPASSYFYPNTGCSSYAQLSSGACAWPYPTAEVQPSTQNINVIGSITKKFGDNWKADLKISAFNSQVNVFEPWANPYFPSSFSPNVSVGPGFGPTLVGTAIPQITVPATYPGVPAAFGGPATVNGWVPGAPPYETMINSMTYRNVVELNGVEGAWEFNSSMGYTKANLTQTQLGAMNIPAMNAALNRPTHPFNVLGNNTAADMANIFPADNSFDTSDLWFVEARASRPLMTLPGGDFALSFGGQYLNSAINSPAPNLIAQGIVSGNNAYVTGSQTDTAGFLELVAPVWKPLEIDASLRYDHINNAGDTLNPKFAFKYTPIHEVALRGTWSRGFRAPNPAENGQSGQAYLAQSTNDPTLCPGGIPSSGNIAAGSVVGACSFAPVILNSSNTNLVPETSVTETIGVITEPVKNWGTSLDVYRIAISNQIVAGTPSTTPVRGPAITTQCADGNGGTYTCIPQLVLSCTTQIRTSTRIPPRRVVGI